MTLTPGRARRLGIWAPATFAILAESVRQTTLEALFSPFWVSVAAVTVTFFLAWAFSCTIFRGLIQSFKEQERLRGEMGRLLVEEQRAKTLADTLYAISRDLTSITDVERNLPSALQRVRSLVGSDMAALVLQDDDGGDLALKTWISCESCPRTGCPLVQHLAQTAVVSGTAQIYPSNDGSAPTEMPDACEVAAAAVPIRVQGAWFGALVAAFRMPHRVTEEEVTLLSRAADGAAVAFENARLYSTVESMAALRERQRLARELHDSLAQSVAFIRGRIEDIHDLLGENQPDRAREVLARVVKYADHAERDVREAIWELRGSSKAPGDFVVSLQEHLGEFSRHTRIAAVLDAPADWHPCLPLNVEVQLVRIVQEALANVRKHARASRVRVALSPDGHGLNLTLSDNGRGFDLRAPGLRNRYGLQSMKERAATFGAVWSIESHRGHGTCIAVRVPLSPLATGRREGELRAHSAG